MADYRITPLAANDLVGIIDYVAKDNLSAADKVLEDFIEAFEHLSKHSELGHLLMDNTTKPFRFWPIHLI